MSKVNHRITRKEKISRTARGVQVQEGRESRVALTKTSPVTLFKQLLGILGDETIQFIGEFHFFFLAKAVGASRFNATTT